MNNVTQLGPEFIVCPDPDLMSFVPQFLQNRRAELEVIERSIVLLDFETIHRMAHTWKGNCRPFGFFYLETLSIALDAAVANKDQTELLRLSQLVREFLEKVIIKSK